VKARTPKECASQSIEGPHCTRGLTLGRGSKPLSALERGLWTKKDEKKKNAAKKKKLFC